MSSSEAVFASQLRNVASSKSDCFAELVELAGLDPKRDFRNADLSGADLRGQDLSAFDLSYANLTGALIVGAKFGASVSRRQKRTAVETARAMVLLVGDHILEDEAYISQTLGLDIFMPTELNEAYRHSVRDSERRRRKTGNFVGDNSDLIRRRLHRAINTARSSVDGVSIIVFEPTSDFDFDALGVTIRALERREQRPLVIFLPQKMCLEENGRRIVKARVGSLDSANLLNFSLGAEALLGPVKSNSRLHAKVLADRAIALGFVSALSTSKVVAKFASKVAYLNTRAPLKLVHGRLRRGEDAGSAIYQTILDRAEWEDDSRVCRTILISEKLFSPALVQRLASRFFSSRELTFGIFPKRGNEQSDFYCYTGPNKSNIWHALGGQSA